MLLTIKRIYRHLNILGVTVCRSIIDGLIDEDDEYS